MKIINNEDSACSFCCRVFYNTNKSLNDFNVKFNIHAKGKFVVKIDSKETTLSKCDKNYCVNSLSVNFFQNMLCIC